MVVDAALKQFTIGDQSNQNQGSTATRGGEATLRTYGRTKIKVISSTVCLCSWTPIFLLSYKGFQTRMADEIKVQNMCG